MNINGIGGAGAQSAPAAAGSGQAMDAQSKNIRKQIEEAQKKLQEISSDGEMNPEEKMKKRQEIQKQISDLRMQLQKHQAELRRQQQAEKKAAENQNKTDLRQEGETAGISTAGMQAVISADNSMRQAKVQDGVAVKMEGRAGVLEAEIKQDGRNGGNTQAKEAELAGTRKRADAAKASGIETLKEANERISGTAGERQHSRAEVNGDAEKAEVLKEKEAKTEKTKAEKTKAEAEEADKNSGEPEDETGKEPGRYVDVRL